jgi:hypothetical protein
MGGRVVRLAAGRAILHICQRLDFIEDGRLKHWVDKLT